jgi:UDP-N-acetylmuramyl pentapeptide phosphotransferase/UDP-N-acetylglucosamine-1-phosphate transferase
VFNLPPAKIESGSTGKSYYGLLLATLSIMNGSKLTSSIIVLTLPIVDFIIVVVNRYIKHKPKNLLSLMRINDTTHFHHKLMTLGLSSYQILLSELSFTVLVAVGAVLTTGAYKLLTLLISLLSALILILSISFKTKKTKKYVPPKKSSPEQRYQY